MFQRLLMVALASALTFHGAIAIAKDKIKDKDQGKVDVTLTAPAAHSSATAPATLTVTADATTKQDNHPVVQVDFFAGATLIGTATTAPYAIRWTNVAAGNYLLSAQATNDKGDQATSAPVAVNVNAPPTVSLIAPTANASYTGPATVTLSATAADSDGTIAKVDFFDGTTRIGSATSAPYSIVWSNVAPGNYSLTAVATDNQGAATTSAAIAINVNARPTATLTAPANNASYTAPAAITLSADAADTDGTIAQVAFFDGATLLGTAASAPYAFDWTNVAAGNYTITAVATDNQGATATAATITVNVNAPPAVTITAPANGASYTAPASMALTATATDADGSIVKVDFFNGATLLGTATGAPYIFDWANVVAGNYTVTAIATDNQGATATASAVQLNVNAPPTVTLTAPSPPASYLAPATIMLTASASDADGTVARVTFRYGSTVLASVTAPPYQFAWTDAAPGTYAVTATVTDNQGATTTAAPVTVTVVANQVPSVTLTAPVSNQGFVAPASVLVNATAGDADGAVARVDFYAGTTLVGTVADAPYLFYWTNVPPGNYALTAQATDNLGGQATSAPVTIAVMANAAPSITLSAAASGPTAPATVTLTAQASDADGSIAQVDFFQGDTLLGSTTTAPYAFTWNEVGAGTYAITARAIDDAGASTTSAAVTVTLAAQAAAAQVYFIETDQLNTPRLVTDQGGHVVWQWDNTDPFGHNVPVANAGFEFNLRFPGQVFDNETGLHYNYFRDYDPSTGRYVQSDPIGLDGGINTYGYVGGNPITGFDFYGLLDGSGPNSTVQRLLNPTAAAETSSTVQRLLPIAARAAGVVAAVCTPGNTGQDKAACADDPRKRRNECKDDKSDCRKASKWDLKQAGINDEHAFKNEHGAVPWGHYDICKCRDGSIRIAKVGQCGRTSNFWE